MDISWFQSIGEADVEAFRIRLDEALRSIFKWLSTLPMALDLEPDGL